MRQAFDQLISLVIKVFVAVLYSCSKFRLKRKIYSTRKERITDLIIGIIIFPAINGLILLLLITLAGFLLDNEAVRQWVMPGVWIINITVFILALILRPYIGIGYAVSFVIISLLPIVAGIFVVGGCFAIIIFAVIAGFLEELSRSYPTLILVIRLSLGGLVLLGILIIIWRSRK